MMDYVAAIVVCALFVYLAIVGRAIVRKLIKVSPASKWAIYFIAGVVVLFVFSHMVWVYRMYHRFKECPASVVVQQIAEQCGWQLSTEALNGKAAKARSEDGDTVMILVFETTEDAFRSSFPAAAFDVDAARLRSGPIDFYYSSFSGRPSLGVVWSIPAVSGKIKEWWQPHVSASSGRGITGGQVRTAGAHGSWMDFLADVSHPDACKVYVSIRVSSKVPRF